MTHRQTAALSALLLILLATGVLAASANGGPTVDWWVIAGGGAPSAGGAVSLNDTLGQPVIGYAAGGSVTLEDGYWPVGGAAAPLAVTDLSATRAGAPPPPDDCRLDWTAVPGEDITYSVYRAANQPYFPAVTPYVTDLSGLTYTDGGVLGDTSHAYYYLVRAFKDGAASPISNRVGTLSFALTPGTP